MRVISLRELVRSVPNNTLMPSSQTSSRIVGRPGESRNTLMATELSTSIGWPETGFAEISSKSLDRNNFRIARYPGGIYAK